MHLKSVLVVDGVTENLASALKQKGINVVVQAKITKEELLAKIPDHDAVVVRSASTVSADVLNAGKSLKVVARAGAGVDNVDIEVAKEKGVRVVNAPGGNALSACELTCSLLLALARHVPQAAADLKNGKWNRSKYMGTELNGKVLAVIGLGRVGREVARRMHVFGMKVIGFDPLVSAKESSQFFTEKIENLEDVWGKADYITLHTPLIRETRDMVNSSSLQKCKKGVRIVNVGRGGLIAEADLLEALKSGKIGGVALDVFNEEPPKSALTKEIIEHPAVIATPHLGASTVEAQERVAEEIAKKLIYYAENGDMSSECQPIC